MPSLIELCLLSKETPLVQAKREVIYRIDCRNSVTKTIWTSIRILLSLSCPNLPSKVSSKRPREASKIKFTEGKKAPVLWIITSAYRAMTTRDYLIKRIASSRKKNKMTPHWVKVQKFRLIRVSISRPTLSQIL
jgi:hypothetical protein